MSVYLAWGTQSSPYSGPDDEPFLPGASGTITFDPSPSYPQSSGGRIKAFGPVGTVVSLVGYSTKAGGERLLTFSGEIEIGPAVYPWSNTTGALSAFFSELVVDADTLCEIYGYAGGKLLPKKLVYVITETAEQIGWGPRFYGTRAWYEEDAELPQFWTNFVNAEEVQS